jgi:hypothetical protein
VKYVGCKYVFLSRITTKKYPELSLNAEILQDKKKEIDFIAEPLRNLTPT